MALDFRQVRIVQIIDCIQNLDKTIGGYLWPSMLPWVPSIHLRPLACRLRLMMIRSRLMGSLRGPMCVSIRLVRVSMATMGLDVSIVSRNPSGVPGFMRRRTGLPSISYLVLVLLDVPLRGLRRCLGGGRLTIRLAVLEVVIPYFPMQSFVPSVGHILADSAWKYMLSGDVLV